RKLYPNLKIDITGVTTQGDKILDKSLDKIGGKGLFTKELELGLLEETADIAVHSLKDMSSEHFFGGNRFAVPDRNDVRDIAIFNKDIINKIRSGESIIVGTCSPRREEMATEFLRKALPQIHSEIIVETKPIRGNVETRLRKLNSGEYDATILATAGLNRLLSSESDSPLIKELLKDKKLMLLPLIECVPAPCQGAVVGEAHYSNQKAIRVLGHINDQKLFDDCVAEKKAAAAYGKGCLQKFGVTTLSYEDSDTLYAAGRDQYEKEFNYWYTVPELKTEHKNFFSSTDHMGSFFEYDYDPGEIKIEAPVVYVSNYKALAQSAPDSYRDNNHLPIAIGTSLLVQSLQQTRVWAAGTKTWYELAKQGIWVEGCADAFGLEFLERAWQMPLLNISKEDVQVITNHHAAANWREKGWKTSGTYETKAQPKEELAKQIAEADIIFWTSFQQYELYKDVLKKNVQHVCPSGETAVLLRSAGLDPIVFPNIKSFQQWRKTISHSPSVG
ncbi:MAG: hydroxymethylbilane synthase, partial [Chitinophagaceae bacterium]